MVQTYVDDIAIRNQFELNVQCMDPRWNIKKCVYVYWQMYV